MAFPLFERMLSIGDGPWLSVQERQYVRFLNGAFGLSSVFGVLFGAVTLLLLDARSLDWGPFAGFFIGALTLYLQHRRRYTAAQNVAYLGTMAFVSAATLATPEAAGLRIYLLVVALASFMLPRPKREQDLYYLVGCVLYAGMDWLITQSLYGFANIAVAMAILYVIGSVFRHEHAKAMAVLTERDGAVRAQNKRLTSLNVALHEALRTSEEQARRLDELNAAKDRVVSVLSHDLRSPLLALDGMLGAYEEGLFSPEDIAELMPDTRRSLASTREQVEDVLAWARTLLSGAAPDARTALADAVQRTVAHAEDRAAAKNVRLEALPGTDVFVGAEPSSVLLLLRNLVANAIKFTPAGGRVTVSAETVGEGAVLRVSDTGVGISPERLAEINEGVGASTTSLGTTTLGTNGEKGSGLGLTLCREVATHFGGRLYVDSAPGEGTTVALVFPSLAPEPEGDVPEAVAEEVAPEGVAVSPGRA